ncbi:hypothetical protein [Streptomyces sp. NPDC058045]|uniref:hypothetical protein n=1 Tax=Streptomyces sp. NPDC058045 TaxID=3346311 RepID=UPI0036E9CC6B
MITSTPVARWSWGREAVGQDHLADFIRTFASAFSVLKNHRLLLIDIPVKISIHESGNIDKFLFRREFNFSENISPNSAESIARSIRSDMFPGEPGGFDIDAYSPSLRREYDPDIPVEKAFALNALMVVDYIAIQVEAYSDAWMQYDLKARPQLERYAVNRPRLAIALNDISEATGGEIDPDDATWFGKPTEDGIENLHYSDGSIPDVWGQHEIPHRNAVFHYTPEFGPATYARSVTGPIHYVPVVKGQDLLGYLWISDPEVAASYEPFEPAEGNGYKAGIRWIERLDEANARGLSPSAALTEFASLPEDPVAGRLDAASAATAPDLAELRVKASYD